MEAIYIGSTVKLTAVVFILEIAVHYIVRHSRI